jgi:ABC-type thiamine transport system substrate-binding protein
VGNNIKRLTAVAVGLGMAGTLAACGSSDGGQGSGDSKTVTLVSHDSWAASKDVIAAFEKQSGYQVDVLKDGDAGQAVNKAILTKDNPQGDVFFGVDNTLLSRALDNGLFQSYEAKGSDMILPEYRVDQDKHRVTPIDTGDICVNYDKAYFSEHKLAPPDSFDDLIKPAYKNLLVTENASTSSPPAEVIYADPKPTTAPTGVATGTCFRQVEYAGLLSNAGNAEGGKALLDFLLTKEFQDDMPLNMFVYPVREGAQVPAEFTKYGPQAKDPETMDPAKIADNRDQWVKSWTSLVLK